MEQRHVLSPGTPGVLTPGLVADRLAAGHDPRGRSDAAPERRGGPASGPPPLDRAPTPAAVLVALMDREEGLTVLLTRRAAHLAHHPGQVSFPGGRLEAADGGDAVACALRESAEEVGLPPDAVTVVGRLDDVVTGTGFIITPVVGVVRPPPAFVPDPFEVAEVFEVPLAVLADAANYRIDCRQVAGRERRYWAVEWEGRLIWGATAGILVNLADVLAHRAG